MNATQAVNFSAKIIPIKPLNEELTLCKCYVMAIGKNRNGSNISKAAADNAIPTMFNIPVIGHVYVDEDGNYHMGGHDKKLERDAEGKLVFKQLCVPFGVVPDNNNIRYEEFIDSLGNEATYQVADIILWTGKYPVLKDTIYDENTYFGQSMEINVKKYNKMDDGSNYIDIKEYTYSALCLLGKDDNSKYHVEPCFPDSKVEPYHFSLEDETNFKNTMEEFKRELSECFQAMKLDKGGKDMSIVEAGIVEQKHFEEKVEDQEVLQTEDKQEEIVETPKTSTDEQSVQKETEDDCKSEEEISPDAKEVESEEKDAEEEIVNDPANNANEDVTEEATPEEETIETTEVADSESSEGSEGGEYQNRESFSFQDKYRLLSEAVSAMSVENSDQFALYFLNDFDDDYVYFTEISYIETEVHTKYFRAKYDLSFDKAEIVGAFESVSVRWLTEEEVKLLDDQKKEYAELKMYKEEKIKEEKTAAYDKALAEFFDLAEDEEFIDVVDNKFSYQSVEELKDKCYSIRGKKIVVAPSNKKSNSRIPVESEEFSSNGQKDVYGGLFEKYPPKKWKI